jgi:hypothetical protein
VIGRTNHLSPKHPITLSPRSVPHIDNRGAGWARMVAGAFGVRGKSELHRARVPGESRGGRRATACRQSRSACGQPRESNRDQTGASRGEKGNPPRSNLRIGRLQVARRGRKTRAVTKATTWPVPSGTERDDHREQNSAYSPTPSRSSMVPIAQLAERLSVEQEVTGSCPVRHPRILAWLSRK